MVQASWWEFTGDESCQSGVRVKNCKDGEDSTTVRTSRGEGEGRLAQSERDGGETKFELKLLEGADGRGEKTGR